MTEQSDVGLVALLIVPMCWPDITYPVGLIEGLPAVGYAPNPVQQGDLLSLDEVLEGWVIHNALILAGLHPGRDDAFALSQAVRDAERLLHTSHVVAGADSGHKAPAIQADTQTCHHSIIR